MAKQKNPTRELFIALIPILFLVIALWFNVYVVFGDSALRGSNQMILMMAGAVAVAIGMLRGVKFRKFVNAFSKNIADSTKPILIILLIGGLAGTWMISGVVPAMIYYGLQILSAKYFLAAALIICALVSLATGSSWGTTATVGFALIVMGRTMGMNDGMVAGAIISGAYFGDKMSPLSDTTNLAPAMAGSDLVAHIRYMSLTTTPSILIALAIFLVIGLNLDISGSAIDVDTVLTNIKASFNISPWLFLVPALVIFLIARKVDALIAIFFGVLAGGIFTVIFQPHIIADLANGAANFQNSYQVVMQSIYGDVAVHTNDEMLAKLFSTSGMRDMLSTVWLILAAMIFGGALEAAGFLRTITQSITKLAKSVFSLVASTVGTCVLLNVTASDQYLAIVVPGRMFKDMYREKNLAPENLSRSLEDAGTVTSVLIPWNTCGAYQSGVLGVATGEYFMYAFFNLISPFMTMAYAFFNIKIKKLKS